MELRVKCAVCAVAMCLVLRAGSGMEHKFRYYTDNSGLSSNTIQCLYQDDKGYVWLSSEPPPEATQMLLSWSSRIFTMTSDEKASGYFAAL